MKIIVNCISELNIAAKSIINGFRDRNVICFYGAMGVGKTTLIKEICSILEVRDVVTSPTFSIVNEYLRSDNRKIYHFDFYRIDSKDELFDLGYEEYLYGNVLSFIEWPEKMEDLLPEDKLMINVKQNKSQRIIEIIN